MNEPHTNKVCIDCLARPACKIVLKGWFQHLKHRPDFVRSVVQMAMKNGVDMRCLREDDEP